MGKKPFILLAAAGLFALLTSCGDNVVVDGNKGPDKTGTINVYVRDGSGSDTVLNGATVTLLNGSAPKKISQGKGVSYTNLVVGDYAVRATKPVGKDGVKWSGYFNSNINLSNITTDGMEYDSSTYIPRTWTGVAYLYPISAKLSGTVRYKIGQTDSPVPAEANARVLIEMNDPNIEVRKFYATVGANGQFTADSLPAVGDAFTVTALPFTYNGKVFKGGDVPTSGALLLAKSDVPAQVFGTPYTDALVPLIIETWQSVVDTNEALVFTFSDDLEPKNVGTGTIVVYSPESGTDRHEVTFAYDAKKLTITPKRAWKKTASGTEIRVEFRNLVSKSGDVLESEDKTIGVQGFPYAFGLLNRDALFIDTLSATPVDLHFSDVIDVSKISKGTVTITGTGINENSYNVSYHADSVTITPLNKWYGSISISVADLWAVSGGKFSTTTPIVVNQKSTIKPFALLGADTAADASKGIWILDSIAEGAKVFADSVRPIVLNFNETIDTSKYIPRFAVGGSAVHAEYSNDAKTVTLTRHTPWNRGTNNISISQVYSKSSGEQLKISSVYFKLADAREFEYVGKSTIKLAPTEVAGVIGFEFNDSIDVAFLKASATFTLNPVQPYVLSYSADRRTVYIRPNTGREWIGTPFDFDVTINSAHIQSTRGKTLDNDITVHIVKENQNVEGLVVATAWIDTISTTPIITKAGSTTVSLYWLQVPGADGYRVVRRKAGENKDEYVRTSASGNPIYFISQPTIPTDTVKATVPIKQGSAITIDSTYTFLIEPITGTATEPTSIGSIDVAATPAAAALTVFARPTLNAAPTFGGTDFSLSADTGVYRFDATTTLQSYVHADNTGNPISRDIIITFESEMDTLTANRPTLAWGGTALPSKINFALPTVNAWSADCKTLTITFNVTAAVAHPDDVVGNITVSGLKNKNGQPFFVEYEKTTSPSVTDKAIKGTLDLRIVVRKP